MIQTGFAQFPSIMLVYIKGGSAEASLRAATIRWKLHIKTATSPDHIVPTPGQPVLELTLNAWRVEGWPLGTRCEVAGVSGLCSPPPPPPPFPPPPIPSSPLGSFALKATSDHKATETDCRESRAFISHCAHGADHWQLASLAARLPPAVTDNRIRRIRFSRSS